jgi:hypothetical protein
VELLVLAMTKLSLLIVTPMLLLLLLLLLLFSSKAFEDDGCDEPMPLTGFFVLE